MLRKDNDGQGLVEYAMILALVSLLFFASYTTFGNNTNAMLLKISNSVSSVS